jgi:molybdopterin-guanine dinucleotide biosynthesis protein B
MKVFGVAGYSGMGKTTLLERLVPEIARRGLRVSLIKHSDKDIEVDRPGKDSYRLREAGCHEVLVLGSRRWALMHELAAAEEPSLDELLSRLHGCDLVLVEGFKHGCFPKLEVWRAAEGRETLWPGLDILAVAAPPGDGRALRMLHPGCRLLPLGDVHGLADFVLRHAQPATGLRELQPSLPEREPRVMPAAIRMQ